MKVFVIDKNKKPLMPCHPARAKELLKNSKAAVYRMFPFTIILLEREGGDVQEVEVKLDPGSKTTGISVVVLYKRGWVVVWAANLAHKSHLIVEKLIARRAVRRSRRNRNTRYRPARFINRAKAKGWLPPSKRSRIDNVVNWVKRLINISPITAMQLESVKFDSQKMANPEIDGIEYQQGELLGYEVREYLLEKWERTCAYCGEKGVLLEIEHIIPKSKGGSNRVNNLTLACHDCNKKKGNMPVEQFLASKPDKLKRLKQQCLISLKSAADMNSTRYAVGSELKKLGLPVFFWTGGMTKFNRYSNNYPKEHWVDAACVGETGRDVDISKIKNPLLIKAIGRGIRQVQANDKHGFPKLKKDGTRYEPKRTKRMNGFQTGDIVKVVKKNGRSFIARMTLRRTGYFYLEKEKVSFTAKECCLIQRNDGFSYSQI